MTDPRIDTHTAKLHRTDHYSRIQLEHLRESATPQERQIAGWFYKHPGKAVGPSELHEKQGYSWPLTSTRRAICNLTDAGILVKTDRTSPGKYNRPEHKWKWKVPGEGIPVQGDMFGQPATSKSKAYEL